MTRPAMFDLPVPRFVIATRERLSQNDEAGARRALYLKGDVDFVVSAFVPDDKAYVIDRAALVPSYGANQ